MTPKRASKLPTQRRQAARTRQAGRGDPGSRRQGLRRDWCEEEDRAVQATGQADARSKRSASRREVGAVPRSAGRAEAPRPPTRSTACSRPDSGVWPCRKPSGCRRGDSDRPMRGPASSRHNKGPGWPTWRSNRSGGAARRSDSNRQALSGRRLRCRHPGVTREPEGQSQSADRRPEPPRRQGVEGVAATESLAGGTAWPGPLGWGRRDLRYYTNGRVVRRGTRKIGTAGWGRAGARPGRHKINCTGGLRCPDELPESPEFWESASYQLTRSAAAPTPSR